MYSQLSICTNICLIKFINNINIALFEENCIVIAFKSKINFEKLFAFF